MTRGGDSKQACDALKKAITQVLFKYTKSGAWKHRRRQNLPWFNERLWHLMKERDTALKKYFLGWRPIGGSLKVSETKKRDSLERQEQFFFLDVIKLAKGNTKMLWKCIDQISGKEQAKNGTIKLYVNCHISGSSAVTKMFNDYFINSVLEFSSPSPVGR